MFGSFILFTGDRFIAVRAYEILNSDARSTHTSMGVIRIDDAPVAWRNLAVQEGGAVESSQD
ncbi:hypothetical protein SAMN06265795_108124 [Noviherbaspirillum humi]|uniref:Uncharacterized protein n=2 Tax=Noviherbaspirillum humi TaxID=1688639 RepID=A0A239I4L4_9BURK|nr:hypothetical protein SAMN06265795_108124 [Noviherbaspirillum humi]